ncbi:MAG: tRNA pseudouridine(55) synthase TruB [Gallionella sp.]
MGRTFRPFDGVLLFDKALGLSSNAALQKVRHLYQAEKAGHTGTLDPLATGLLPICFGEATKFSNCLLDADKTYQAIVRLGQTTTTGDAEGVIVEEHPVAVDIAQVHAVLEKFRGAIWQLPPMYSALKYRGRPLYEYIRSGQTVERDARKVEIHDLILDYLEGEQMAIKVRCSKGTYVRTLAEDVGAALGCGAHLIGLRRSAIAHFDLADAYDLQRLQEMDTSARDCCVLSLESLMPKLQRLDLDQAQVKRLAQGQRLLLDQDYPESGRVMLIGPSGFIGLGTLNGRHLAPERLLSGVAKEASSTGVPRNFGVEV